MDSVLRSRLNNSDQNLTDSLSWWLNKKKPFVINGEYKVELVFINKDNNTAKIRITNLKNGESEEVVHDGN